MPIRSNWRAMAALLLAPLSVWAQWMHYPTPGMPRTQEGKPDLNAPASRRPDGKPDLSGIWAPEPTPLPELLRVVGGENSVPPPLGSEPISRYFANLLADYKSGEEPLRGGITRRPDDPALACLPTGMPMFDTYPQAHKIVQTTGLTVILHENDNTFRQIFTDGRGFPDVLEPSWLGSSIGRWEGDTLVVTTVGLNGRSSLDLVGHTHTDRLRITERFRRVSMGKIELQLLLDDPRTFIRPVAVKFNWVLFPDTDLLESFCSENEKDRSHIHPK